MRKAGCKSKLSTNAKAVKDRQQEKVGLASLGCVRSAVRAARRCNCLSFPTTSRAGYEMTSCRFRIVVQRTGGSPLMKYFPVVSPRRFTEVARQVVARRNRYTDDSAM